MRIPDNEYERHTIKFINQYRGESYEVQSNYIKSYDESYLTNSGWQNPIRRFFLPFIGLVRTST